MNKPLTPERLLKRPIPGAAGGINEEELEDPTGVEIFDVRPITVGLVSRGANRRAFFLAKAEDGGNSMGDATNYHGDELDAALTEIEQAAAMDDVMDDEAEEEEELKDKKKKPVGKSVLESISDALVEIANRRSRDPISAATRALGNVGGHPELITVARDLMDFIEAARKKGRAPDDYGYPAPQKKETPAPANDDREPGQFSVAEKGGGPPPDSGGVMPEPKADLTAQIQAAVSSAITSALDPLIHRLDELETGAKSLQQSVTQTQAERELAQVTPLAKSFGIKPATVVQLKKSLPPEEFLAMTQRIQRAQRMAEQSGFFAELGSSAGGEGSDVSSEVVLEKKAKELMTGNKQLDLGQALIEASMMLGIGLDETPTFSGEEG